MTAPSSTSLDAPGHSPEVRSGSGAEPAAGADPVVRVGRALARLSRLLEQTAGAAGLTLAQYRVLVFVSDEPCRASALAAKVDVRRATLSSIVAGLERDGLLDRVAVEDDGRGVLLRVTPAGAEALAAVERSLRARLVEAAEAGAVAVEPLAAALDAMVAGFIATQDGCGS